MHPDLSFDQAPPIDVPYRFFLTAPLFGVLAGLLLVAEGAGILASRWNPATLAGTHLLVTGFMLQAMCGALLQFVPVAAGGNVWRPRWLAGVVHPLLIVASALLATAFLTQAPILFNAAALAFAVALTGFIAAVGVAIWRTPARGATIAALRLALAGLLVTGVLGILLALGLAGGLSLPLIELTQIHAAWGLGGWALVLLAGVAYFVVPMFQLTPVYPAWLARGLPLALWAILVVWSLVQLQATMLDPESVYLCGLGVGAVFGGKTLYLQSCRRRKVSDVTLLFFRTAMLSLVVLFLAALIFAIWTPLRFDPRTAAGVGVLVLIGVFYSAINGMLYKILPFLNWLHLQREGGMNSLPPPMNQMIPERWTRYQLYAHWTVLALLLGAIWLPALARPAGVALAGSSAALAWNLFAGVSAYRRFRNRIRAAAGYC